MDRFSRNAEPLLMLIRQDVVPRCGQRKETSLKARVCTSKKYVGPLPSKELD